LAGTKYLATYLPPTLNFRLMIPSKHFRFGSNTPDLEFPVLSTSPRQLRDLRSVDSEGHLLVTRQLDDKFQLLAGRMHQLDSHIALDFGDFSAEKIATQEIEAQQVERCA